jgi:enterochelin esterase-like enzyme
VDATLPTIAQRSARAIAGLSAGGYGALDIGLRNPLLFGTLESWSGSFRAPHDGSLAHADAAERAANDPTLLVRGRAALLRRLGTRFFLSAGTHDRVDVRAADAYARLLRALRLPVTVSLAPGGHSGREWRGQLTAALEASFPPDASAGG